jgi:hypothetical protein
MADPDGDGDGDGEVEEGTRAVAVEDGEAFALEADVGDFIREDLPADGNEDR